MARDAQARGLQPKRGNSRRTALLVLDVMSDFAFEDVPAVRRALVARCEGLTRLIGRAHRNGVPVDSRFPCPPPVSVRPDGQDEERIRGAVRRRFGRDACKGWSTT